MIRFSCPRCKAVLESPDESAGAALTCPCGQRLEIPTPRPKTVPDAAPASRVDYPTNPGPTEWPASPPAPLLEPLPQAHAPPSEPGRRPTARPSASAEECAWCGGPVHGRGYDCYECRDLLCSERCLDAHEARHDDEDRTLRARSRIARPESGGAAITVGVLTIIWAAVVLLLGTCTFLFVLTEPGFAMGIGRAQEALRTVVVVVAVALILWSVTALAGGIGVLLRAQWARILTLVVTGLGLIFAILFLLGGFAALTEARRAGAPEAVIAIFVGLAFLAHMIVCYAILFNPRVSAGFR